MPTCLFISQYSDQFVLKNSNCSCLHGGRGEVWSFFGDSEQIGLKPSRARLFFGNAEQFGLKPRRDLAVFWDSEQTELEGDRSNRSRGETRLFMEVPSTQAELSFDRTTRAPVCFLSFSLC
jgi:hypothetical protein